MFEGYAVSLPGGQAGERRNPEPRELLDELEPDDIHSEVRRASPLPEKLRRVADAAPMPTPIPPVPTDEATDVPTDEAAFDRPPDDAAPEEAPRPGYRQTLTFGSRPPEVPRATPIRLEATIEAARAMLGIDPATSRPTPRAFVAVTDAARRKTPLGLGAVLPPDSSPELDAGLDAGEVEAFEVVPEPVPDAPARAAPPAAAAPDEERRSVELCITLSAALLGGRSAYVTVSLAGGEVLYEGDAAVDPSGDGRVEMSMTIPVGAHEVKAMVEAGGVYRTATIALADEGVTLYTFA